MKRLIPPMLPLVLLLCLVGGPGCTEIDWVDFIKLNDITYTRVSETAPIDETDLVLYAEIKHRVAGNVHNPDYKMRNGDAAYHEAGTPVYAIAGYAPTSRLAVKRGEDCLIYHVSNNPSAKTGGDLWDIGGKVEYIGVNGTVDGAELASISEQTEVNELVRMVLEAAVDQGAQNRGSEQYFLEFHLNDGTTTTASYWLDTAALGQIQLPAEFGATIRAALEAQQ